MNAAQYGYWNGLNIIGMLIGGISAKMLLQRISAYRIIYLGLAGCIAATVSLILMWYFQSVSALWFFTTSLLLYWFAGYLFAGGSLIASNAISDKASASSMMSFVNMGFATLSVILMGYLSHNSFTAFIMILSFVLLGILCLLSLTRHQRR